MSSKDLSVSTNPYKVFCQKFDHTIREELPLDSTKLVIIIAVFIALVLIITMVHLLIKIVVNKCQKAKCHPKSTHTTSHHRKQKHLPSTRGTNDKEVKIIIDKNMSPSAPEMSVKAYQTNGFINPLWYEKIQDQCSINLNNMKNKEVKTTFDKNMNPSAPDLPV